MISGAMYSGVPTNEYVFSPRTISLANPKSTCPEKEAGTLTPPRDDSELGDEVKNGHQFDVALHIQHQVLWLQVSVHDVLLVEISEGLHHAGGAEHSRGLIKAPSAKIKGLKGWSSLPLALFITFSVSNLSNSPSRCALSVFG